MVARASPGDNVTVCGGKSITVSTAIVVELDADISLTLCCQGQGCRTIESDGGDHTNLRVSGGGSFAVQDITFGNGVSTDFDAANLVITRMGDVRIERCNFDGGRRLYAGNVDVSSINAIVTDSTFTNGKSSRSAGGASLFARTSLIVQRSTFHGNSAAESSGGLQVTVAAVFSLDIEPPTKILIDECTFTSNTALRSGDGLGMDGLPTALGVLPTMSILNSSFDDNVVVEKMYFDGGDQLAQGGAGFLGGAPYPVQSAIVVLAGKSGSGNSAAGCDGFYSRVDPAADRCQDVNDDWIFQM